MRKTLLGIAGTAVLLLAGAGAGFASDVNCGIVNKDLKMGRDPKDISERMMISVDDVKKCQAQAGAAAGGAGAGETGKPGAAADNPKGAGEKPAGMGGH
jgi:hypothetical protein